MAEQMGPENTFRFLNSYLTHVAPVVAAQGGFIDKYIGDAIMALFPRSVADALRAAVNFQLTVRTYNEGRLRAGYQPIRVGIGVHVGPLVLGTIGHARHMQGTVIADAVNVAARLEGLTKVLGTSVLVTGETLDGLDAGTTFLTRRLPNTSLRGKSQRTRIFEVFDGDPEPLKAAKRATREEFERAIGLIENGNPTAARIVLRELVSLTPHDEVIQHVLETLDKPLDAPHAVSLEKAVAEAPKLD
jgi:class 3 adenylate cyclase